MAQAVFRRTSGRIGRPAKAGTTPCFFPLSSHRGAASVQRLREWYPNAIQVHTPVHASWLNQIEIYFSIVQRKVLTPNDFHDLDAVEARILEFQDLYQRHATPFQWKFSREDLKRVLQKCTIKPSAVHVGTEAA